MFSVRWIFPTMFLPGGGKLPRIRTWQVVCQWIIIVIIIGLQLLCVCRAEKQQPNNLSWAHPGHLCSQLCFTLWNILWVYKSINLHVCVVVITRNLRTFWRELSDICALAGMSSVFVSSLGNLGTVFYEDTTGTWCICARRRPGFIKPLPLPHWLLFDSCALFV